MLPLQAYQTSRGANGGGAWTSEASEKLAKQYGMLTDPDLKH